MTLPMIILAAGQGTRLRPLTNDRPKCLVALCERPLLDWQMDAATRCGVPRVSVVAGYCADQIVAHRGDVRVVHNARWATTNMVASLACADAEFGDGFVMAYGDIAYRPDVLRRLLASTAPIAVVVDRGWRSYWAARFDDPLSDAETLVTDDSGAITDLGRRPTSIDAIMGQYIGLAAFRGSGVGALRKAIAAAADVDSLFMTDLLRSMISAGERLQSVDIDRGWVEVDSERDLAVAARVCREGAWATW